MSHRAIVGVFVVAILGLGGPAPGQQGPPALKDRQLLEKQRVALAEAFNRNDAAAWAAVYAADAEFILETGEVARGPAAIRDLFAKLFADNKGIKVTAA